MPHSNGIRLAIIGLPARGAGLRCAYKGPSPPCISHLVFESLITFHYINTVAQKVVCNRDSLEESPDAHLEPRIRTTTKLFTARKELDGNVMANVCDEVCTSWNVWSSLKTVFSGRHWGESQRMKAIPYAT
jgi:hypothetical protein